MSAIQPWADAFQAHHASLPGAGAPWLASLRQQAMARFADLGWPSSRQDGWRHTSLAALADAAGGWAGNGLSSPAGSLPAETLTAAQTLLRQVRADDADGNWLVFVDGTHVPQLSQVGALPDGVRLDTLADVLQSDPAALEPYYGDAEQGTAATALNTALAGQGVFLTLARGVTLDAPLHLVFLSVTPARTTFVRNLIAAEQGASATVVEHYVGLDAAAVLSHAATRTFVARDARITHLKLQQEGVQSFHLGSLAVTQQGGSSHQSHSLSFGARLARHDISAHFQGKHCDTLLNGLYLVDGKRHVDHHTLIDHAHPDGISHEYYRGILGDSARGVFRGRILVAPGADRTDAVQRSDSLLLSRLARSDAQPELEIYADDVKCAHGATVGQLDEDSLFYLRSRGLGRDQAYSVLVYAFAAEALGRIENPALRQHAVGAIRKLLPGGDIPGELA